MAIRHVKRRYSESSESSSSDESVVDSTEISVDINDDDAVKPDNEESQLEGERDMATNDGMENNGCSDLSSDSEDSSSEESDEEPVFQRPIFIKRNQLAEVTDSNNQGNVLRRIEHENKVVEQNEEAKKQIATNYTTDKEILMKAMSLNDNDLIDPEGERLRWLERQKIRKEKYRKKLIDKQLELEEYEANKLLNRDIDKLEENTTTTTGEKDIPIKKSNRINNNKGDNEFKPKRVVNVTFKSLDDNETSAVANEDSEYSIL
ncbi:hypothetical protein Kpol_1036p24 [Vanderwaltozyma polyspora DSM 70294]|uniref:Pre-mRNA-splicing factor SPP381 n=1 Tax=Vanderwaltozyma polyspora (strain ATCC 22028 / DSM 70294 / BCRC 21397 / CBS 2163 / NBRC 10782 / NRRL Y-8283 / UCD 57-17) TaxID=436907 RepID=SP381_VANPO|nr:uncharacterized protein Kpol_1036p24 [Vanderwaltozyma polyspora DSM 70294]A7TEH5.1 RecName: Full=Pre-mRNA-splicing factor SPP381 [Vanderwaltozyma polyspora DSM 70294]EDO19282.1 hypothetical protein Kpol_1036p24 [Vanderwaltozyma polyspora DSM 70294]